MEETRSLARPSALAAWRYALRTCNSPLGEVDTVTRWLVLTRACVQPMTLTAAAFAGLLAVRAQGFRPILYLLAATGIILAHATNNLMNDLFDVEAGSDTADYPRALYAPHPVLSGLVTRGGLLRAVVVLNLIDLAILTTLTLTRGWLVVLFALAGFFISVGYAASPLRLKKRGLGELGVFLVWGPLMIGGTYFAATGQLSWRVILASIPYALLSTAVLMGKHIDKLPWDRALRIHTLPVVLGEGAARRLTQGLMASFYLLLASLVLLRALPVLTLVALFGLGRLREVWPIFQKSKPDKPPESYPVWPLWYAAAAFIHTRRAGAGLVVGLALGTILPLRLPA